MTILAGHCQGDTSRVNFSLSAKTTRSNLTACDGEDAIANVKTRQLKYLTN
ncbi:MULTISPECIES: hypothetical protein [Microcystis]|jgi:hypothetical protein|uniref:Uncharacterized protein n=1 Tax=Microcystis viridis NIES-102 TaxID=213615 RepID=A0A3G9K195_MICVR|nr:MULTISPECIES: hypothetical protein [Microcystis]MDJ0672041.1 hypothetical protein [Microcystis sp. M53598_WE2]NCR02389.1 hypothetical protein [Microcystis aeruginosa L211-11]BBH41019.1 hypothetical protein myaer102_36080 [Microcystis viridis NIES-102]